MRFLAPLKQISAELQALPDRPNEHEGQEYEDEGIARGEMGLLDGMLEMVEKAMKDKGV